MAKVVVVSGSSSGIGLETCKILAGRGLSVVGTVLYAKEAEATEKLVREAVPGATIRCPVLVLGKNIDAEPTLAAVRELGELVGIVNNAGRGGDLPWEKVTDRTVGQQILDTNFFGLRALTYALEPLLAKDGFIVNVSSDRAFINMEKTAPATLEKLQASDEEQLEAFANAFIDRYAKVEDIDELDEQSGFHLQAYGFSKMLVNRLTELLAVKWPQRNVTACTPGFCRTTITSSFQPESEFRTAAAGAKVVAGAADGPTGFFCFSTDSGDGTRPLMKV